MRRFLVLDFETRSEAPLKKIGAWEYSQHETTRILCVAWRLGTREELRAQLKAKTPCQVWSPYIPSPYGELVRALCDPEVIIIAHNALFEQAIAANVLTKLVHKLKHVNLSPERWLCTAALAAALALPRSLGGACSALGLSFQKDVEGHKLMMKMCKPRKPTKKNPSKWVNGKKDLLRLMSYCGTDVDAETELFLTVEPLTPMERKVWELDQKINLRGFATDQALIDKTLTLIAEETKRLNHETDAITWGGIESATQRDAMLKWLEAEGVFLPDLRAKTVADYIKEGAAQGDSLRLLQIRQAISKTSTAKYIAFKMRSKSDHRVRDNLVYCAASTGRWGGAGVQPQNFPRGVLKDVLTAIEAVNTGDLDWIRFLYGNPMNVFASCLRGVIIASPGKKLFCADYAAIEARMGFWFARHDVGIKAFVEGRDLYCEMASKIFGRPAADIKKGADAEDPESVLQRFVGKQVILGCSYQMGAKKFMQTCLNLGQKVELELAELAVDTYRNVHHPVKKLWGNLERAAIAAVKEKGKRFTINRTTWFVEGKFLWCQLPSGRRLAYYGPVIKMTKTSWGEDKMALHHWSTNQRTRKWELAPTYGGKLAENVVQGASRDLMAEAMIREEEAGYEVILSVHDELLAERGDGKGSVAEFENLMAQLPAWAAGAPVSAKGWSGERYRK